jgi:hypothetical protein
MVLFQDCCFQNNESRFLPGAAFSLGGGRVTDAARIQPCFQINQAISNPPV